MRCLILFSPYTDFDKYLPFSDDTDRNGIWEAVQSQKFKCRLLWIGIWCSVVVLHKYQRKHIYNELMFDFQWQTFQWYQQYISLISVPILLLASVSQAISLVRENMFWWYVTNIILECAQTNKTEALTMLTGASKSTSKFILWIEAFLLVLKLFF